MLVAHCLLAETHPVLIDTHTETVLEYSTYCFGAGAVNFGYVGELEEPMNFFMGLFGSFRKL